MSADERHRYRLLFGKGGPLRWLGHLDLQRAWLRTMRRAALPLLHTRGHHPRPRLAFAAALPLGWTSDGELLEIWLQQHLPADLLRGRLRAAAPPGIVIHQADEVAVEQRSLAAKVRASLFAVTLDAPHPWLAGRIAGLLGDGPLPRERRGKGYDLRPRLQRLELAEESRALRMQLLCREGAVGRPDEVLDQLGLDPADCEIHRERLLLAE